MKEFSVKWKSSKSKRKKRKYEFKAPLHIKGKKLSSPLSKELKQKFNKKSLRVRKGDKIKVMRGTFKGKIGKVNKVDIKKGYVLVDGVNLEKKDGTKMQRKLNPSKLMLLELNMEDKERMNILKRK